MRYYYNMMMIKTWGRSVTELTTTFIDLLHFQTAFLSDPRSLQNFRMFSKYCTSSGAQPQGVCAQFTRNNYEAENKSDHYVAA